MHYTLILNNEVKDPLLLEEKNKSLSKLIEKLDLRPGQVAIKVNNNFIQIKEYKDFEISNNDSIEIITLIAGG